MEQWIILFKNDLDYPCAMPEEDDKGIQSYKSLADAKKAWVEFGMSNYFSAYAFDLNSGDVETL